MTQLERFREIAATYRKYAWRLERVLMRADTLEGLRKTSPDELFEDIVVRAAPVDAMWFRRPSHAGREAWELRLVAEPAYALFELFEVDEVEEDREDVRREMEAQLADYAGPPLPAQP